MKFNIDKKHISFGITAFLVIAASICFYYLIFHGDRFLAKLNALIIIANPILYGIIFAYLMTPIVNFLESRFLISLFTRTSEITVKKKKYMRIISLCITIVLVVLVIYGFFSILIPDLITSIEKISFQFSNYVQNLTHFIEKYLETNPDIEKFVMQIIGTYSENISNYLNDRIPQMESILKTMSLSLISVVKVLWNLIIGLIISIYVLFNKETFAGQFKKILYALFSQKHANSLIQNLRFTSNTFLGFLSGKIVDSVIIGILCFIGTYFLKMPYPLLISVIVGVTNIIPFFGPYIGAIPSAILVLMINPLKCLYFIIFILILQQLDGNVIGPKILGQSTGLTGFWVIFSITIFGGVFGVVGMIIGVPFFAVVYAMIRRMIESFLSKKELPVSTRDYIDLDYIDDSKMISKDLTTKKKFFHLPAILRKKQNTIIHNDPTNKKEE